MAPRTPGQRGTKAETYKAQERVMGPMPPVKKALREQVLAEAEPNILELKPKKWQASVAVAEPHRVKFCKDYSSLLLSNTEDARKKTGAETTTLFKIRVVDPTLRMSRRVDDDYAAEVAQFGEWDVNGTWTRKDYADNLSRLTAVARAHTAKANAAHAAGGYLSPERSLRRTLALARSSSPGPPAPPRPSAHRPGPRPRFSLDDVVSVEELDAWSPPAPPPPPPGEDDGES